MACFKRFRRRRSKTSYLRESPKFTTNSANARSAGACSGRARIMRGWSAGCVNWRLTINAISEFKFMRLGADCRNGGSGSSVEEVSSTWNERVRAIVNAGAHQRAPQWDQQRTVKEGVSMN